MDYERRLKLMKEKAPKIMHGIAEEFSSSKGSKRHQKFANEELNYM